MRRWKSKRKNISLSYGGWREVGVFFLKGRSKVKGFRVSYMVIVSKIEFEF